MTIGLDKGTNSIGTVGLDAGTNSIGKVEIDAGSNHAGQVGGHTAIAEASYTRPANTTAYADGDAVADSDSAPNDLEFTVARINDEGGFVVAAQLIDSVNSSPSDFDLILFDTAPTPTNDNEAFALSDADAENILPGGVISFRSSVEGADLGANNYTYSATGLNIPFVPASGTQLIYGLLVVRGAYTPASGEKFTVRLGVSQD